MKKESRDLVASAGRAEKWDLVASAEKSRKKIRILISKTANVRCCKRSLYTNRRVMSIQFIFGDD